MKRTIVTGARRGALVVATALIILAGCSNPFQAGLGNSVDIDRPDGDINSPDAGQYLSGAVTLSGSYSDDMSAIPTVTLEIDGVSGPLAASVDESGWSYQLDTRSYADGEHEIVITITDASGKSATKRQLYYFDNSAPLVLMTIPQSYAANSYNGDVTVRGEAADQFGLTRVEYRILDNADQPKTNWAPADGTNSWAFIFDSRDPVILSTTTGTLKVAVRATDRAGNVSEAILHYDDVRAATGGQEVTVEALRQILAGEAVAGAPISKPQIEAALFEDPGAVPIDIDQALDNPTFVISNPDENSTIDENVLPGSPKITGTVEDDSEGVNIGSIEYRVTSGGSTEVDWTSVDGTNGTGLLVRWNATISGLTDGDYELEVRASDTGSATGVSNAVPFRVDSGAPSVDVTSPAQGTYINGTFPITGTAYDLTTVNNVRISLDGGGSWYNYYDTEMGGDLTGSAPNYNWYVTIDPDVLNLDDGPRTIKVEATDGTSAAIFNLQVVLDNQAPSASFITPSPSSSVNGEAIIRGTASDNNQVKTVELKIGKADDYIELPDTYNWEYTIDSASYANDTHATETSAGSNVWKLDVLARVTDIADNQHVETGYFFYIDNDLDKPTVTFVSPSAGQRIAGPILVSGTAFDDDAVQIVRMQLDLNNDGDYDDLVDTDEDGNTDETYEDETVVYTVDGTTLWSYELNNSGELYGAPDDGNVTIGVWAEDIYGTVGNAIERTVQFDDTIPRAENLNYSSSDYVNGDFDLTADILDDVQVKSVKISYNGGQDYVDLVTANTVEPAHTGDIVKNSPNDFSLNINIDTATTLPGLSAPIDSGILYLRLRIEDEANYQSISYINLNVDNLYPAGTWSTAAADPQEIDGTAARVQGTATDSGAVSGIGAVEVYLMRSGQVLRLSDGTPSAPASADFSDAGGAVSSFDYAPSTAHRIRIDDDNEFGNDAGGNGDGDGYDESLTIAGSTYTWWAEFDSTPIDDGAVDIHYVVYDSAGNGTHYVEPGFIKNNRPVITDLTVGTDLDYSGTVEGDEQFSYAATRFTARGHVYVVPTIAGGNGSPTYEVFESSDLSTPLSLIGDAIDISDTGAYPDGDYTFVLRVTDDVAITTESQFLVQIDQEDTVAPSISITEEPVPGDGNVEPSSPYNPGNPALSGTLTVSGTASDDQRIQEIRLTAPGIGTNVLAASWVGGATNDLTSQLAGFTIDTNTLSEDTGQAITWSYTWDTATHPSVAATGVSFEMSVQDYRSGAPAPVTASQPYDIVPYITDVEVGMESGTLGFLRRSAQGAWSIAASDSAADTLRITGYNLAPAAGDVTVGTSALTIEGADATAYTWVDVRKNSTTSGELTVTSAGVDSINNTNNNALSRNQEAAIYYPDRTDDRFLRVWSLESKTGLSGMTEAVMRPNGDRTDMDWLYVNNGQQLVLNGTTLTNSWSLMGGDLARNDSGTLMWIFLHNMNWNSAETSYSYYGSVQWGKDEANEASAVNWHRAAEDRLGLGNLSFDGDGNYAYGDPVMERYRNLRILTDGTDTDTDNFVAYFDAAAESRSIVFWSFKTGNGLAAGDQVTALANGWDSNLEKFTEGNTGANYSTWTGNTDLGLRTPFNGISRTEVTSGGADSRHFSTAWDDANGMLYLAYYDETTSELRLAYNLDPVGTPAAWTTRATPIDTGAGLYVESAVDPDGGVHLAYFDGSQSNLKYAYLPSHDVADAGVERYTIDALFTNGMYNGITIRDFDETAGTDYRPVISSFSLSYSGTPYAIRTSWPLESIGSFADGAVPATGNYTGDWETITVPAATPPQPVRSFVETDGTTEHQGRIVVGYNGGYVEEATLLDE